MPLRRRAALLALATLLMPAAAFAQAPPTQIADVIYQKQEGVALTMDVFKPEKPNGIGVLWMVSGGWVSNHNSISPAFAKIFTDKGITVFQIVHGTQPRFKLPEIVPMIHRAVRFVRTHAAEYGVDPNRLGISGGSAGGHLSLMMGAWGKDGDPSAKDPVDRASSRVQAVACFFPPTDFLNYGKEGASAYEIPTLKGYWQAFGVTEQTPTAAKEKLGRETSPIYGDLAHMPPTLILHGDADLLVPIQQSQRFIGKLEENKIPCKLVVFPGKAHGWIGIDKDGAQLADWFVQYLGKK